MSEYLITVIKDVNNQLSSHQAGALHKAGKLGAFRVTATDTGQWAKGVGKVINYQVEVVRKRSLVGKLKGLSKKHRVIKADRYHHIKSLLQDVRRELKCAKGAARQELIKQYEPLIQTLAIGLKNLYASLASKSSAEAMIQRNDILEALAEIVGDERENRGENLNSLLGIEISRLSKEQVRHIQESVLHSLPARVSRAAQPMIESSGVQIAPYTVPLINFGDLQKAVEKLPTGEARQLQGVMDGLGEVGTKENVPMGRVIDLMYQHGVGKSERLNRLLTKIAGAKRAKDKTHVQIATFFKGMNITIESEFSGQLYAYSEMFTQGFRQEKTEDTAFQREPSNS